MLMPLGHTVKSLIFVWYAAAADIFCDTTNVCLRIRRQCPKTLPEAYSGSSNNPVAYINLSNRYKALDCFYNCVHGLFEMPLKASSKAAKKVSAKLSLNMKHRNCKKFTNCISYPNDFFGGYLWCGDFLTVRQLVQETKFIAWLPMLHFRV